MKQITSDNYIVTPFVTNKEQRFDYVYPTASTQSKVWIDHALHPVATWSFQGTATEPVNLNGIYKQPLYKSLSNLFYYTGSAWNSGPSLDKNFLITGSEFYVVNVSQKAFGEGIKPGSFLLTSPASTASLYDDGNGHIISATAPNLPVGNIFYNLGIAVIKRPIVIGAATGSVVLDAGLFLTTGSALTVKFNAIHTIYEHRIICTVDKYECNYSTNPTLSGSLATGSSKVIDLFASESLVPYVTSVGLYNDVGEMVAIAKFPRAIKRAIGSQQTFIIRFDA